MGNDEENIMLKPLRDCLIVSVIKADEKMAGGLLYRPATVDEDQIEGKVVAVGSGLIADNGAIVPLEVQVGDVVLFHKSIAVPVKHNGETYHRLREEQIISLVK